MRTACWRESSYWLVEVNLRNRRAFFRSRNEIKTMKMKSSFAKDLIRINCANKTSTSISLDELLLLMKKQNQALAFIVGILKERYGREYVDIANYILKFILRLLNETGNSLDEVLAAYQEFIECQIEQYKVYASERIYRTNTLKNVQKQAESDEFKLQNLFTLSLSYLFAPFRFELLRFVRASLDKHLAPGSCCLEIATGAGFDTVYARKNGAEVFSYDLNKFSGTCLQLLNADKQVHFSPEKYSFSDNGRFDHAIMIELLEHVENPSAYLTGVQQALKTGGSATISFALNLPQLDHVYLFRSIGEARTLLKQSGFALLNDGYYPLSFFKPTDNIKKKPLHDTGEPAIYACVVRAVEA